MFDELNAGDMSEGDDAIWTELLQGWLQTGPAGGEGPDPFAEQAADDLSERLRRNGGRLPGSDPRR